MSRFSPVVDVSVAFVVHWHDVQEDNVVGVGQQSVQARLDGREHSPASTKQSINHHRQHRLRATQWPWYIATQQEFATRNGGSVQCYIIVGVLIQKKNLSMYEWVVYMFPHDLHVFYEKLTIVCKTSQLNLFNSNYFLLYPFNMHGQYITIHKKKNT